MRHGPGSPGISCAPGRWDKTSYKASFIHRNFKPIQKSDSFTKINNSVQISALSASPSHGGSVVPVADPATELSGAVNSLEPQAGGAGDTPRIWGQDPTVPGISSSAATPSCRWVMLLVVLLDPVQVIYWIFVSNPAFLGLAQRNCGSEMENPPFQ